MNYSHTIKFGERYGIANKLEKMITDYALKHNRFPELILIDAFSLLSLNENETTATAILDVKTSFMGISLQAVETEHEFILLQRLRPLDVIQDAKFHAESNMKKYLRSLQNLGIEY